MLASERSAGGPSSRRRGARLPRRDINAPCSQPRMQTHIVPVGCDYDRLIAPLIRDQFDVDRVILLEGAVGSEANVEYSRHLSKKLEQDFRNLLGATTERVVVADVYDYDAAFEQAYDLINAELDEGREVWVNISSMPRTVSFAFATAAHSIM